MDKKNRKMWWPWALLIIVIGSAAYFFLTAGVEEGPENSGIEQSPVDVKYDRMGIAGNVNIIATYLNPTSIDNQNLNFKLAFETHSVKLGQYKPDKISQIETESGVIFKEDIVWKPESEEGHHVSGILSVPVQDSAKVGEANFTLVIKNIEGVERLEFNWK